MIPLRKPWTTPPPAGTRIDPNNPLAKSLKFCGVAGTKEDAVSHQLATVPDTTASNPGALVHMLNGGARAHESNNTTDGGVYWNSPQIGSAAGTKDFTILVFAELDSSSNYGVLFCNPADPSTWATPFHKLALYRDNGKTSVRCKYTGSDDVGRTTTSNTGFLSFDGSFHVYGARRKSADNQVIFYKDGARQSVKSQTNQTAMHFNNNVIGVFSRNEAASGDGINGRFSLAMMFARALSDNEILSLSNNPWQIFVPRVVYLPIEAGAPPASTWPHGPLGHPFHGPFAGPVGP